MPFATPNLLIRGEGLFDKLRGALGFDDIDFESEEFSRRFYVVSTDKKFAYDVVHPRMMEWLMAKEVPLIDIERGRCCLVNDRGRWKPDEFKRWLRRVDEFFRLWPDYLLSRLDVLVRSIWCASKRMAPCWKMGSRAKNSRLH